MGDEKFYKYFITGETFLQDIAEEEKSGAVRKGIAIVRVLEYHKTINQRGRGDGVTPGQQRRRTLPFRRTDCKSADGAVDEREYVLTPLRKSPPQPV